MALNRNRAYQALTVPVSLWSLPDAKIDEVRRHKSLVTDYYIL